MSGNSTTLDSVTAFVLDDAQATVNSSRKGSEASSFIPASDEASTRSSAGTLDTSPELPASDTAGHIEAKAASHHLKEDVTSPLLRQLAEFSFDGSPVSSTSSFEQGSPQMGPVPARQSRRKSSATHGGIHKRKPSSAGSSLKSPRMRQSDAWDDVIASSIEGESSSVRVFDLRPPSVDGLGIDERGEQRRASPTNSRRSSLARRSSIKTIKRRPSRPTPTQPRAVERQAEPIDPRMLATLLEAEAEEGRKTLLIDARPKTAFAGARLTGSVNVCFPTLLLRRFRKGNPPANFSLHPFLATNEDRHTLESFFGKGKAREQDALAAIDVVVIGENGIDRRDTTSTDPAQVLLGVLERLPGPGLVQFLEVSFVTAASEAPLRRHIVSDSASEPTTPKAARRSTSAGAQTSPTTPSHREHTVATSTRTPTRKRAGPRLKRIDTSENLLALARNRDDGQQDANEHGPAQRSRPCSPHGSRPELSVSTPRSERHISGSKFARWPNEVTATPGGTLRKTMSFEVSTIIPSFLYLGPEPVNDEDFDELERLDVKQVLNLALECTDPQEQAQRRFEKYWKIPMRDFIDETGVQQAMEKACAILADAQLQSKPVYCHCQAGKSRSVTIVIAYLVHRNHWSLKRAYAHVSARRSGISPNIGFVSELLKWEEKERGSKSSGHAFAFHSVPASPVPGHLLDGDDDRPGSTPLPQQAVMGEIDDHEDVARSGTGRRFRPRDSLPPLGHGATRAGQSQKEMEVLTNGGRWAPAQLDARDEFSNPYRRASRAGLESI